jgi:hypothetical protein
MTTTQGQLQYAGDEKGIPKQATGKYAKSKLQSHVFRT